MTDRLLCYLGTWTARRHAMMWSTGIYHPKPCRQQAALASLGDLENFRYTQSTQTQRSYAETPAMLKQLLVALAPASTAKGKTDRVQTSAHFPGFQL